ncbi:hypothetical protein PPTG_00115 [Phytophthora nicotianae INRA-310]|uniref:Uncharacterized protein n=1 Tax=Phytophthora nicotianae (strain INRA-310) TaxID=761204 RepID=W2RDM5_PHYN3|nr:hypothetical protein PPTG_00115 [Phytophthora nicotianae INRA-310]ETN23533.1 hypothetical protein PPTG_00115 [Phytophthora nicotianae INRA-310]
MERAAILQESTMTDISLRPTRVSDVLQLKAHTPSQTTVSNEGTYQIANEASIKTIEEATEASIKTIEEATEASIKTFEEATEPSTRITVASATTTTTTSTETTDFRSTGDVPRMVG